MRKKLLSINNATKWTNSRITSIPNENKELILNRLIITNNNE